MTPARARVRDIAAGASRPAESPPPAQPPAAAPTDGRDDQAPVPAQAWWIIREYFASRYVPSHRCGDSIYSTTERREVRRVEACAALAPQLIGPLSAAENAPRQNGAVKTESLPGFFKKWSGTGWSALVQDLPDEDAAALDSIGDTAETFRQLIRQALLTEVTIAWTAKDEHGRPEQRVERRSLVGWCQAFARPGIWKAVRSKCCWTKLVEHGGGEVETRIAIRSELFSQVKADRRLVEMSSNTFTRRAERYGIGRPGGQGERPHGRWALILDRAFVEDLTAGIPDDDSEICTDSESANDPSGAVQLSDGAES